MTLPVDINVTQVAPIEPSAIRAGSYIGTAAVKEPDGTLRAQGAAAEGVFTSLHYADSLDIPANKRFRDAFKKLTNRDADVYAVQGYDTAQLLIEAMNKVQGDTKATKALTEAFYGRPARYCYYEGASTGGRHGYRLAQQYPGDYDGILASMPQTAHGLHEAGHGERSVPSPRSREGPGRPSARARR